MSVRTIVVFLLTLIVVPAASAAVIHVPADQPTIQAGIDAAMNGDTVLVADGTWRGPDNRDLNFRGKAITLQSENGPHNCIIDAGDPSSPLSGGSTRTDLAADSGVIDLGFHWSTGWRLAAGPGPGPDNPPDVHLFLPCEGAEPVLSFTAYGVPRYGVNLAVGDLLGVDGRQVVTGPGPGEAGDTDSGTARTIAIPATVIISTVAFFHQLDLY
jgi:hypothetical protein